MKKSLRLLAVALAFLAVLPAKAAGPEPYFYESSASAWERYSNALVEQEKARREGNRDAEERARNNAAKARVEADEKMREAETRLEKTRKDIAARQAQADAKRAEAAKLHADYQKAHAAAADDYANDGFFKSKTPRMKAASNLADRWKDTQERATDLSKETEELHAEARRLEAEASAQRQKAAAASARIEKAQANIQGNPALSADGEHATRIAAARAFFNNMKDTGYDAKFLLMDTRNLKTDVEALKTVLDTQLNSTLMGHYVNSQIGKMGANFCGLANECAGANAARVPQKINDLLQSARQPAGAVTDRVSGKPTGEAATSSSPVKGVPAATQAQ